MPDTVRRATPIRFLSWTPSHMPASAVLHQFPQLAQPQHRTTNRDADGPVGEAEWHGAKRLLQERQVDHADLQPDRHADR